MNSEFSRTARQQASRKKEEWDSTPIPHFGRQRYRSFRTSGYASVMLEGPDRSIGEGWSADDTKWNETFASRIVDLCRQFPNVYCEVGYLLALFSAPNPVLHRFKQELLCPQKAGQYAFHKKVMYGSDWHMQSMLGKTHEYLDIFYRVFKETPEVKEYAPDFFSGNARRFLGPDATSNPQTAGDGSVVV